MATNKDVSTQGTPHSSTSSRDNRNLSLIFGLAAFILFYSGLIQINNVLFFKLGVAWLKFLVVGGIFVAGVLCLFFGVQLFIMAKRAEKGLGKMR